MQLIVILVFLIEVICLAKQQISLSGIAESYT
jgi:hypothetical protein